MLQLSIKVVVSDTLDVKLFHRLVNLDVEWIVSLEHSKSLFLVMAESGISSTLLKVFKTLDVSYGTLEIVDKGFHQARSREELSGSGRHSFPSFNLSLELWSLSVPIAVKHLSILDPEGMDHGVSIEPVVPVCGWHELWVWPVSQVDSVDVGWDRSLNNLNDLIRLLVVNRSEVAFQDWVLLWINPLLFVDVNFDWFKEQPQRNLVQRIDNGESEDCIPSVGVSVFQWLSVACCYASEKLKCQEPCGPNDNWSQRRQDRPDDDFVLYKIHLQSLEIRQYRID